MIKIIKPSVLSLLEYIYTCPECGAEFEFQYTDIELGIDMFGDEFNFVECPTCRHRANVKQLPTRDNLKIEMAEAEAENVRLVSKEEMRAKLDTDKHDPMIDHLQAWSQHCAETNSAPAKLYVKGEAPDNEDGVIAERYVYDTKTKREFLEKLSALLTEYNAHIHAAMLMKDLPCIVMYFDSTEEVTINDLSPETIERELKYVPD
jgi:DNA-directed RNA polymerase subunit RPC12/RpoP